MILIVDVGAGLRLTAQSERRTMAEVLVEHTSGHVVTQSKTVTIVSTQNTVGSIR